MSLVQVNVPDDVKKRADDAFAKSGLTTAYAMRILITQVANTGRTPFDGLFMTPAAEAFSENLRRDMVYAEAQELGLIPDDSPEDPTIVPPDVLVNLGIKPSEVGQ